MDFTREPVIESVITPKEGCKLVVRSSTSAGQEEFFVDAVEVVSFGNSFFFRSLEKPKPFIVPASDYEILEVREARMVLKNVGLDRSIKIGGGKKEGSEAVEEPKLEKKRERRRNYRRKRGQEEVEKPPEEAKQEKKRNPRESRIILPPPTPMQEDEKFMVEKLTSTTSVLSSLLPPPPNLISETIERYKDNALFKDVFYQEGMEGFEIPVEENEFTESEEEDPHLDIEPEESNEPTPTEKEV